MGKLSYHERRGKPRLYAQSENATFRRKLNRNLPSHKRSKIAKIQQTDSQEKHVKEHEEDEEVAARKLKENMWKHASVSEENPLRAPMVRSSFATRFPFKRKEYIEEMEDRIKEFLQKYGIGMKVDYGIQSLEVYTTKKTWDPYSIIKARDFMRLVARYVPFKKACEVMKDDVFSEVIETGKQHFARQTASFIQKRARLIGPNVMYFLLIRNHYIFSDDSP